MHFWIDKPAGRNYGFGGRRYTCSSSAPKSRSGQRGRRGREIGPMVTPVHRFQSLNGPSAPVHSGVPGPSATRGQHQQQQHHHHHHQHHHQQQQPQPQQQQQQQQQQQEQQALVLLQQQQQQQPQQQQQQQPQEQTEFESEYEIIPQSEYEPYVIHAMRPINFASFNNVTNAAAAAAAAAAAGAGTGAVATGSSNGNNNSGGSNNERQIVSNDTTNNGLNSRASFFEGHFSEISDTELAGYRLRCGVWITFVLATGFVSVAKFYFGHRDGGLDMLIFCGLLFTLLLSGCFYSTLFRRAQNTHRHHQDHLEQDEQIATLAAALTIRDENARGFQDISPIPQNLYLQVQQRQMHQQQQQAQQQQLQQQPPPPPPPPPPPYHIAILIPPPNSPEEAPPPSYDKAMNEDSSNHTRVFIFSKDEDN